MPFPRKYPGLKEKIIEALKRKGPMTMTELANFLKIPRTTLIYHVKEMVAEGILEVEKKKNPLGRARKYYKLVTEIPF